MTSSSIIFGDSKQSVFVFYFQEKHLPDKKHNHLQLIDSNNQTIALVYQKESMNYK